MTDIYPEHMRQRLREMAAQIGYDAEQTKLLEDDIELLRLQRSHQMTVTLNLTEDEAKAVARGVVTESVRAKARRILEDPYHQRYPRGNRVTE